MADDNNVSWQQRVTDWLSQQWQPLKNTDANQSPDNYQPTFSKQSLVNNKIYIVGIHPLHNPKRLFEVYAPIIDFIDAQLPDVELKLEASRNYEEFDKKLYSGHFDFAMPNPYQTIRSLQHGYKIFAKMADDQDFRGIILVRKDSGIKQISDLKGKAVSYPAKTALAATMMPQQYLHTHGVNINTDIENRYVGSQESSIMNVLLGHVAAAATWPVPWKTFSAEHPEQAAQLEIKWQTESLPNNGWVVRNDIPAELVEQFAKQLLNLQNSEAGQKMLAAIPVSHFEAANEQTYAPVQAFLNNFNKTVRPIEQ
jgi:phosphonate transport system substrate-binding protein